MQRYTQDSRDSRDSQDNQNPQQNHQQGYRNIETYHDTTTINRWMSGNQRNDLWQLYETRNFADLWYGARSAGERLRGLTLERLYRNRPYPGGPHPDPREPSAFSDKATLSVAASLVGLRIDARDAAYMSRFEQQESRQQHEAEYDEAEYDEETGQPLPYAWIMTYPNDAPPDPGEERRHPRIILRTLSTNRRRIEFEIACLMGYWHRDHARLADGDAPTGAILLPQDPSVVTLLHQYAIALLLLKKDCPDSWTCHCNRIRRRFNATPPDHSQPTDMMESEALIEEAQRQRRQTEPQFPYPDKNRWTEEE
jgi:hypothetical protein